MDQVELRELLRRSPFAPFVVRMSNGESYEVRHPETALLTPVTLYVFDSRTENVVRCALIQYSRVSRTFRREFVVVVSEKVWEIRRGDRPAAWSEQ